MDSNIRNTTTSNDLVQLVFENESCFNQLSFTEAGAACEDTTGRLWIPFPDERLIRIIDGNTITKVDSIGCESVATPVSVAALPSGIVAVGDAHHSHLLLVDEDIKLLDETETFVDTPLIANGCQELHSSEDETLYINNGNNRFSWLNLKSWQFQHAYIYPTYPDPTSSISHFCVLEPGRLLLVVEPGGRLFKVDLNQKLVEPCEKSDRVQEGICSISVAGQYVFLLDGVDVAVRVTGADVTNDLCRHDARGLNGEGLHQPSRLIAGQNGRFHLLDGNRILHFRIEENKFAEDTEAEARESETEDPQIIIS